MTEKENEKNEEQDDVKKEIKEFFKKTVKPKKVEEEFPKSDNLENKYLVGWQRCLADFENYKKRQQENQKNIGEYLKEDWVINLLPVVDNFSNAIEHIPKEQKEIPWVVGIIYIQKQLEAILKENNVVEMEVNIGDEFNPNWHEAVAGNQETVDSEHEGDKKELENKIKKVVFKGYKIGEKVIRPARVIVG